MGNGVAKALGDDWRREWVILPRAYAAVLFTEHPWVGVLFFAATWIYPNIGLAGAAAALIALLTARLFDFPYRESGIHIFNSLLTGLSLGAFYAFNLQLLALIALAAVLTVMVTVVLADLAWRIGRLPVLSAPFVVVALSMAFAAKGFANLSPYHGTGLPVRGLLAWLDPFFIALGSAFFSPHPLAGLLLFLGLLWQSRFVALLAVTGFICGYGVYGLLADGPNHQMAVWNGFNFVLTAVAVGGIYVVPGLVAFALAALGAVLTAVVTAAVQGALLVYGLPVMAIPFLLTTLLLLYALSKRQALHRPWLLLEQPGLPERNREQARLAQARTGEVNSVPVLTPFFGEWQVYQAFNGPHTHRAPWQHALDFFVLRDGVSYAGDGARVEDFHCFGLPIVSPVYGEVVRALDRLPDNAPGEVDTQNNWGNFVLLRLESGLHVLLAHLRQGSLKVKEGQRVEPGTELAACGNSGRSPQPHLHLQVQRSATLGSPTWPFHLTSVLSRQADGSQDFHLVARPAAGDSLAPARPDPQLAHPLHLPVGRTLCYAVTAPGGETWQQELRVELTVLGQFRLTSPSGASAAFEETNGVLAFYDRRGPKDPLLDLWLLAMGLTPFAAQASAWQDAPAAALLPLNGAQRAWLGLWRPLGTGLASRYQRRSQATEGQWDQQGRHELRLPGRQWVAHTLARIDSGQGCIELALQVGRRQWRATLVDTGQMGDLGVPAWHRPASIFEPQRRRAGVEGGER